MAKKKKQKAAWERAYKGHVLWMGKQKLGRVSLVGKDEYSWEGGGKLGKTESLEKAKAAVELAVLMTARQLPLFD